MQAQYPQELASILAGLTSPVASSTYPTYPQATAPYASLALSRSPGLDAFQAQAQANCPLPNQQWDDGLVPISQSPLFVAAQRQVYEDALSVAYKSQGLDIPNMPVEQAMLHAAPYAGGHAYAGEQQDCPYAAQRAYCNSPLHQVTPSVSLYVMCGVIVVLSPIGLVQHACKG